MAFLPYNRTVLAVLIALVLVNKDDYPISALCLLQLSALHLDRQDRSEVVNIVAFNYTFLPVPSQVPNGGPSRRSSGLSTIHSHSSSSINSSSPASSVAFGTLVGVC